MKLKISEDISLPIDSITQTFSILAKRRVGKTYTASVIAEEFVKANLPFVVLDPTAEKSRTKHFKKNPNLQTPEPTRHIKQNLEQPN